MPEENHEPEPNEYREDVEEVPATFNEGMEDEQSLPTLDEPVETIKEQPSSTPPQAALPPEAQGETNGGPLGCCFGVIVGLVLSLIIVVLSELYGAPLVHSLQGGFTVIVRILMGVLALAGVILFGYLGWKIGKKVFREYEPPVVKERGRKPKPRTRPKPKSI